MAGRAFDAALMLIGALLVGAIAFGLGVLYHLGHRWLWNAGAWFPILPGILLGLPVAFTVWVWSHLAVVRRRALSTLLATFASAIVVATRFVLAGLALKVAGSSDSVWTLVNKYVSQQAAVRFTLLGNERPLEHREVFWVLLALEIAAVFLIAIRLSPDAPLPAANPGSRTGRATGLAVALLMALGLAFWTNGKLAGADVSTLLERITATSPSGARSGKARGD